MKPISKETKYILTPTELGELITEAMVGKGLVESGQHINFSWRIEDTSDDYMDRYPSYSFTKLEITVKEKK